MRSPIPTLAAALLLATPAAASDETPATPAALKARVAEFAQPSNAARLEVLKRQLTEAGLPFEVQTFEGGNDQTGPMTGSNVVVALGDGPRDLVMVAHYDAVVLPDGSLSQGLVDNAASVVSMIAAARDLSDEDLDHRLVLILVDQEELGLIDARKWIEAHGLDRVTAVVNADVGAWGDTVMYGLNNGDQSGFVVRALREQCVAAAIQCIAYPTYPPSDDRAFSAAGAPVVSIGWQDLIGAHQMWLAFNSPDRGGYGPGNMPTVFQRIHSDQDILEHVDGDTLARGARFHAELIRRLDETARD